MLATVLRPASRVRLVVALVTGLLLPMTLATPAEARTYADCNDGPGAPTWFYPHLKDAADVPNDGVPSSWGDSLAMAKIVCYESDFYQLAIGPNGDTYGLGQLKRYNVDAAGVSWRCYWEGGCTKDRRYHQLLAAMRYAKSRYGTPAGGWDHIRTHGWW